MSAAAPLPKRGWQNGSLVRRLDTRGFRRFVIVLAWVAFAASPFVVYVAYTMRYLQVSYAIEELRAGQERLLEAERRLRIEQAVLESLREVERKAERELGLEPPAPGHVIVIRPSEHPAPSRGGRLDSKPSPAGR